MKWAALYATTAFVAGLHNLYRIMDEVNGAPVNVLNCISLFGSAILMGAAVFLLFRPIAAAKVALLGSVLCWVFYAPLIVVSLIAPFSALREIRFNTSFHEYVPVAGVLLGPLLLILCTANSIVRIKRNRAI